MARHGVLPKVLPKIPPPEYSGVHPAAVQVFISVIVPGTGGNPDRFASHYNAGTLRALSFISPGTLKLRKMMPDASRSFNVPFSPYSGLCHDRLEYLGVLSEHQ